MDNITFSISVTEEEVERLTTEELADLIELRVNKEIEKYKKLTNKRVLNTVFGKIVYCKNNIMK